MTKTNCFGYDKENHKCIALNALYCAREECVFFKTVEQVKEERAKYDEINRKKQTNS